MELNLKLRKLIANGAIELPKFNLGTPQINLSGDVMQKLKLQNISTNPGTSLGVSMDPKLAIGGGMGSLSEKDPSKFFGIGEKLPKKGGFGKFISDKGGDIMNAAATAIDAVSTFSSLGKNTMSSDEMMGSGGQYEDSANGISYQQSKVDVSGIQDQIDATAKAATMTGITKGSEVGGTIGKFFGPVGDVIGKIGGGLLGGVFGGILGDDAKKEAERQKQIAINRTNAMNALNRETAYTIGLRNEFNRENRTGTEQSLFHAAKGKEGAVNPITMETYKKYIVNTAYGKTKAPLNAWVSKGEIIRSKDGSLYKVKTGSNDTARAYLQDGDSVYSKKIINPETGNPVADDAPAYAAMGMLDRLDMNLNVGRMMKEAGRRKTNLLPEFLGGTNKYKCLPGFEGGTGFWGKAWKTVGNGIKDVRDAVNQFGNIVDIGNITLLGNAYLTAAQRDARAEGLRAPKSFVANPYEQDALQQLNKLHSDYYPVWAMNRELEGRGKSSIAQSGGLAAGQKMLGYMGLTNQTQQNNMAALFEHQGRENALRAQAANAALLTGAQTAARQQLAYQWDEDMLAKAHAARENMWEASAYDRQNALGNFFKNLWENNQFNQIMNLYRDNQKIEKGKVQAMINEMGANKPVTVTGVADNASMMAFDSNGKAVRINPFSASQSMSPDAQTSLEGSKKYVNSAADIIKNATQRQRVKPVAKRRASKKGGRK